MDSVTDGRALLCRVSPFGNLRIDAYVPLPEAYRSLSRPSSAPDAKAFPLRSFSLNLVAADSARSVSAARLSALRENSISLRRSSSPKQNSRFVSVSWFSELCRLISGFLLRNCYPNCLVPQLLLNFLLLPCLSFLCSVFNVQRRVLVYPLN